MSRREVFTSKKMRDRRYRKTEEAILKVFFDEYKKGSTMRRFARRIKIGRSTIYMHHHAIREVIPDYEKYILNEYKSFVRGKLRAKDVDLKTLYFDTLVFVLRNRKFFEVFLKFEDRKIVLMMLGVLKGKIMDLMRLTEGSEKILAVYKAEITAVIFEWGKRGFSENELERVLSDIMYLTETGGERLGVLR